MIKVTKQEKEQIMTAIPALHFARTMKADSKRHHYYMEENPRAMAMLYRMRGLTPNASNRNSVRGRKGRPR